MSESNSIRIHPLRHEPRYPNYGASRDGRIWKNRKGVWRNLKSPPDGSGYPRVVLCAPGQPDKTANVHTLILKTFVGPCPPGMVCRHFPDADKTNNNVKNLSWGTREQNQADREMQGHNGTSCNCGESNANSKLTAKIVREIRRRYERPGWDRKRIAAEFGIAATYVSAIVRRARWAHV